MHAALRIREEAIELQNSNRIFSVNHYNYIAIVIEANNMYGYMLLAGNPYIYFRVKPCLSKFTIISSTFYATDYYTMLCKSVVQWNGEIGSGSRVLNSVILQVTKAFQFIL